MLEALAHPRLVAQPLGRLFEPWCGTVEEARPRIYDDGRAE